MISGTLKGHTGRGWDNSAESADRLVYQESEYGVQGYDTAGTLREGRIPEHQMIAAPLTKGSATSEGVNAPGCRQEDDVNIVPVEAFAWQQGDDSKHGKDGRGRSWITCAGDYTGALSKTRHDAVAGEAVGVRRLTPTECERLQGFEDGWTQLGETPDSRRYSALGDAVTVNVSEWLGRRLAA